MPLAPAMILAAGLGKRMRAHNDQLPKPLVPVAGRPLLAYSLDLLHNAGFSSVVVNTHYKAEMVEKWLAAQPFDVAISHEPELLETGGGVRRALPLLAEAFFVINSDVINLEFRGGILPLASLSPTASPPRTCSVTPDQNLSLLQTMQSLWDDARMDALLLLIPVKKAIGYRGAGDFCLAEDGRLLPRKLGETTEQGEARSVGESEARGSIPPTKYVFTGVQLLHQRFLNNAPAEAAFSLGPLYRAALNAEPCRIFGMLHPGQWFHVGDGEGVREAEMQMGCS